MQYIVAHYDITLRQDSSCGVGFLGGFFTAFILFPYKNPGIRVLVKVSGQAFSRSRAVALLLLHPAFLKTHFFNYWELGHYWDCWTL